MNTRSKRRQPWLEAEIELLRTFYPDIRTDRIATDLGRPVHCVYSKARALGLKKSEAFLDSPDACRLRRGEHVGKAAWFPKGHTPWNKGVKGLDIGGKATRFKPGHRGGRAAENYKPIGTERVSKDGYLERKVNDGMPLQKRWRAVHLLVWEAAHGPLPAGHAVTFKDGNKRNVSLDNLTLISRIELMRRNTVHNYGPEVAELVRLRAQITRQINRRSRHE